MLLLFISSHFLLINNQLGEMCEDAPRIRLCTACAPPGRCLPAFHAAQKRLPGSSCLPATSKKCGTHEAGLFQWHAPWRHIGAEWHVHERQASSAQANTYFYFLMGGKILGENMAGKVSWTSMAGKGFIFAGLQIIIIILKILLFSMTINKRHHTLIFHYCPA